MSATVHDRLRAVAASLLVAVAGFALGIVLLAVVGSVLVGALGVELGWLAQLGISLLTLQGVAFPAVSVAYLRARGWPLSFVPAGVPSRRGVLAVVGGYVGVFLLVFALAPLVLLVSPSEPASNRAAEIALANPDIIPWLIPLMVLVVGPGEELLFRGIIQGTLRREFGAPAAIVLAGLMFAPAHFVALVGSAQAVLTTVAILFVPSLVFGALYEYTRNIVVPALVHGLYNATLLAGLYFAATTGAAPV